MDTSGYNTVMSGQHMSKWDEMVCNALAETDRQIAAGTHITIPATEAHQTMEAHLAKLRNEEAQEQQQRYRFAYARPAL